MLLLPTDELLRMEIMEVSQALAALTAAIGRSESRVGTGRKHFAPQEVNFSRAAASLQRSIRSDSRSAADASHARAASAKRVVAGTYTAWDQSPWRLAAIQDETVSRVKAVSSQRSAAGLSAAAQAAAARAETAERHMQMMTMRAQDKQRGSMVRYQRESLWAAEGRLRHQREQARESVRAHKAAWQEQWLDELQQRHLETKRWQVCLMREDHWAHCFLARASHAHILHAYAGGGRSGRGRQSGQAC